MMPVPERLLALFVGRVTLGMPASKILSGLASANRFTLRSNLNFHSLRCYSNSLGPASILSIATCVLCGKNPVKPLISEQAAGSSAARANILVEG